MTNFNRYISTDDLAEMLNLKRNTIERWRTNRQCPFSWFKIGGRVLYDREDVLNYIESAKRNSINDNTTIGV